MPSSIDEVKDLFQQDLQGGQESREMDEFLDRYYNIDNDRGYAGLESIIRVIHNERKKKGRLKKYRYYVGFLLYLMIDVVALLKSVRHGSSYLNSHYDFCCFIHKPTRFMKKAASRFVADLNPARNNAE